mmetsp:Transcript_84692/g.244792  ORF Transcript_84692/g.244792 Transcript_84692/m.244792 type:complete len:226 (+) Transcript_84692:1109-1786(+)
MTRSAGRSSPLTAKSKDAPASNELDLNQRMSPWASANRTYRSPPTRRSPLQSMLGGLAASMAGSAGSAAWSAADKQHRSKVKRPSQHCKLPRAPCRSTAQQSVRMWAHSEPSGKHSSIGDFATSSSAHGRSNTHDAPRPRSLLIRTAPPSGAKVEPRSSASSTQEPRHTDSARHVVASSREVSDTPPEAARYVPATALRTSNCPAGPCMKSHGAPLGPKLRSESR